MRRALASAPEDFAGWTLGEAPKGASAAVVLVVLVVALCTAATFTVLQTWLQNQAWEHLALGVANGLAILLLGIPVGVNKDGPRQRVPGDEGVY